jgi:hypothetical protein
MLPERGHSHQELPKPRVLESAGVVGSRRSGRENLYRLEPAPIAEMRNYLDDIARQWGDALGRLKAFVEE